MAFLQWRAAEMRKAEGMRLLFEEPRNIHHREPAHVVEPANLALKQRLEKAADKIRELLSQAEEKIESLDRFELEGKDLETYCLLEVRGVKIKDKLWKTMYWDRSTVPLDTGVQMDQLQEQAKKLLQDTESFLLSYRARKRGIKGAAKEEVLKDAKSALSDEDKPDDP